MSEEVNISKLIVKNNYRVKYINVALYKVVTIAICSCSLVPFEWRDFPSPPHTNMALYGVYVYLK
jgi:hypothetical protein